ncbi:hypothetical protein A9236_08100 [Polynucleobacter sp. QLW-P1DATA-2]|uniref:hypothetical protein n=1 Tax=unclassified Polynucleobacter TaxID=2640945 RepID=UPI0008F8295C|nr:MULTISPECIES: hypothetical protein [unclassified Polynucleobacter]OIN01120.1 hypothetical protein A9236_08100 [Polynucleobacter sp. QLW-P1DATA-2]OIN02688.1 hypothetical protein A9235_03155 [Polynucleobacter sp. MWH-Tro8-2-5-gr]
MLKLGQFVSNDEFFVSKIAQKEDWVLPMRILAISTVVFLTLAPFATLQLREIPAFIASYEAALVIVSLITAVFLYAQFYILGMRALFALVVAYLFSAFIAIVQGELELHSIGPCLQSLKERGSCSHSPGGGIRSS